MSDRVEHHEMWHDDIAAYALDALGEREAVVLEEHLAGCERCSERLLWLQPAIDQIPAGVKQFSAPPALRSRLLDIVDAEAEVPRATAPEPVAAEPKQRRRWLPSFEAFSLRPALAGFAVILLLATGVTGYVLHDTGVGTGSQDYTAQADEGSSAYGTLEVEGDKGSLNVANLPATHGNDVYQAWIKDSEGSVHPSSVFVTSGNGSGTVAIPEGLDDAAEVMVTREPKGGSQVPSENPFLTAQIS